MLRASQFWQAKGESKNWEGQKTSKVERPTFQFWNLETKLAAACWNIALFNNCHFNFSKWPCNFQKSVEWQRPLFLKWTIKLKWQVLCKNMKVCIPRLSSKTFYFFGCWLTGFSFFTGCAIWKGPNLKSKHTPSKKNYYENFLLATKKVLMKTIA
jgi:hypothetical protein